jgi:hypothetical protein
MHRSITPFMVAIFGYIMFLLVDGMPLFEWQVSGTVTDSQSNYMDHFSNPNWTVPFGRALDHSSSYFVTTSEGYCFAEKGNLKFVVRRSQTDETLDRISLSISNSIPWLTMWSWLEIILSTIYMWGFLVWHKQNTTLNIILSTGFVVCICILLGLVMRLIGGSLFGYYFNLSGPPDCHGTVTLDARLLKVHYEALIVLLAGICSELGSFSMIFRQTKRAVAEREKSLKSSAG